MTELGHEPRVVLQEKEGVTTISLTDADGVFVTAHPKESKEEDLSGESEPRDGDGEVDELRKALVEANKGNGMLQEEMSTVRTDLERAIERVKDLWKVNCSQLAEFDTTLSAKDEEIARLKQRLERPHSNPSRI